MAETQETPKFDARLKEGVAYFEKMLEMMPDDRMTLEFLVMAYEHLGEKDRGERSLVRLADLLIRENDLDAMSGLLPRLEACELHDAKVMALRVKRLTAPAPDLTPERPREINSVERIAAEAQEAMAAELALTDILAEGGVIDAETAAALKTQVDAMPADGRFFLISAIQILEKENAAAGERAIEFLADKFSIPPIPLAYYEQNKSLLGAYPEELVRLRGAIPFAKMGNLTLIATLNPADARLKSALEAFGPCRLYLADAAAVENTLAKAFGETEEV